MWRSIYEKTSPRRPRRSRVIRKREEVPTCGESDGASVEVRSGLVRLRQQRVLSRERQPRVRQVHASPGRPMYSEDARPEAMVHPRDEDLAHPTQEVKEDHVRLPKTSSETSLPARRRRARNRVSSG